MQFQKKFLKSIIEVSHIEFQSYSVDRRELICTSGLAQDILGYSSDEFYMLSRNFYEPLVHPDDIDTLHESIKQLLDSTDKQIIETTLRYRKADGDYIWAYTRKAITERNEKGEPSAITTVAEDVTDLIFLKNELKEKVSQLQTISWKNSHLLRPPVANIMGLISQIEEKEITSTHNVQIFHYMKQAIEKLDTVIHEINDEAIRLLTA